MQNEKKTFIHNNNVFTPDNRSDVNALLER